jgi:hypothetical protein
LLHHGLPDVAAALTEVKRRTGGKTMCNAASGKSGKRQA